MEGAGSPPASWNPASSLPGKPKNLFVAGSSLKSPPKLYRELTKQHCCLCGMCPEDLRALDHGLGWTLGLFQHAGDAPGPSAAVAAKSPGPNGPKYTTLTGNLGFHIGVRNSGFP